MLCTGGRGLSRADSDEQRRCVPMVLAWWNQAQQTAGFAVSASWWSRRTAVPIYVSPWSTPYTGE
ncbi:MAG: hypothetical protein MR973_03210 [Megasphaera elsdenii]|nr:hypothetical protein [Megasphaera elsdenii]